MAHESEQATPRDAVWRLFERRREAYERKDAPALGADYAADAKIESPFAGVHDGNAAGAAIQKFFDTFRDLQVQCEPPIIDGDRVALQLTFSGTGVGSLMGLPPSIKPYRFSAVHLYRLRGVQIVEERRIYDSTGLWVQVGVLKAKPT